jgi:autophagy-related protein 2
MGGLFEKGAKSFAKATTMETIRLGSKLAVGTQVFLEHADEILSGDDQKTLDKDVSKFADQPKTFRAGITKGYQSLRSNLNQAASTVIAIPMEVYENSGNEGAVPIAVLKPLIGASSAISKALIGIQNTLDPERNDEDKYKS